MDELVRINGHKTIYDGYGSNAREDRDEPVCWHEYCYQKASPEQKLDETPSESAPNQGFGPRHLLYLERYNPEQKTVFVVRIDGAEQVLDAENEKYHYPQYFIQPDNTLQDQADYDRKKREDDQVHWDSFASHEAWEANEKKWASIPIPEQTAKRYETFDEALAAAKSHTDTMPQYYNTIAQSSGSKKILAAWSMVWCMNTGNTPRIWPANQMEFSTTTEQV